MLDAPVARGVPAAVAGTLSIFVGGKKEVYEECLDILKAMGPDIFHVGEVLFEALGAGSAGSFARLKASTFPCPSHLWPCRFTKVLGLLGKVKNIIPSSSHNGKI
jgi:hypothetical protein